MRQLADFVGFDATGKPVLLVEVKARGKVSSAWGAQMRRNALAHGLLPQSRFFLLALPERFYLWKDAPMEIVPPNWEIASAQVLRPYMRGWESLPSEVSEDSLALLVGTWLDDVVRGTAAGSEVLKASGLLDALQGGRIEVQTAA